MQRQLRSAARALAAAARTSSSAETIADPPQTPSLTTIADPTEPPQAPSLTTTATTPPSLLLPDEAAFAAWLAANHSTSSSIWLRISKKSSPAPSISYAAALPVALCYGWIDGQRKSLPPEAHPHHFIQRFTPRRRGSLWSARNVAIAEDLVRAGRMTAYGLAEIDAAKKDGRWDCAYAGSRDMVVPEDFQTAMDARRGVVRAWESLSRTRRYSFLMRVHTAVRPETRVRRIEKFVDMIARGESL